MKFRTLITYFTALCLAIFMSTAMAKKSDKSEKSHKSDRQSEKSDKSAKSDKSDKSRKSRRSRRSDRSERSDKSCKSDKSRRGRGRGRGRRGCDDEPPPPPLCKADRFPNQYFEDIISTEVTDPETGDVLEIYNQVFYTGTACSAEPDPLLPLDISITDGLGTRTCFQANLTSDLNPGEPVSYTVTVEYGCEPS